MKLRDRILILAAVPIFGLFIVGTYLCVVNFVVLTSERTTLASIADVQILNELIHDLQVERGQSAGFVASGGQNFATTLPEMRVAVDRVRDRIPVNQTKMIADLQQLQTLRGQVDRLELKVPELAKAYTALIRQAMSASQVLFANSDSGRFVGLGNGILALSEAKEAAGLQRAAGATGLGAGAFTPAMFQSFVARGAVEAGYLQTASTKLSGELGSLELDAARNRSGVQSVRAAILMAGPGVAVAGQTAPDWFAKSTAWIEELRKIEIAGLNAVEVTAHSSVYRAAILFASSLLVAVLSTLMTFIIGRHTLQAINSNLQAFLNEMTRVGNGDYEVRNLKQETRTEFGKMFSQLDAMKVQLRDAESSLTNSAKGRNQVLKELDEALSSLAAGDVSCTIENAFPPEYEGLRQSYNSAATQLSTVLSDIHKSVGSLWQSSADLDRSSNDLSSRTSSQAAALEQTTAALNQLSTSVNEAAKSAGGANKIAQQLRSDASEGQQKVEQAVEAIEEVKAATSEMTTMVGMIEDIAFQTNLLALNAGVEAARAGESGRGFAVVASEVRALAVRVTETTNDISDLMARTTEKTTSGATLVHRAGESFEAIRGQAEASGAAVAQIATDSQDQSTSIQEIGSAMNELDTTTQRNAALVEDNLMIGSDLSKHAEFLRGLVDQFRLSKARTGQSDHASAA